MTEFIVPETKMGVGGEIGDAFDDFMTAFEAFKEANDERLQEIERRMRSDVLIEEKVDRINAAVDTHKRQLDAITLKNMRPGREASGCSGAEANEHKSMFESYLRRGDETRLREMEEKALSSSSDPDGGYLVPDELSDQIGKRLAQISPVRSVATIRQVSGAVLKKPFANGGPAFGWVGETEARPQTSTPTLTELQFPTMELFAMPAATSSLLDDAALDVDSWIVDEVETVFAEQEGAAFVNGDGVNKPTGFLSYGNVDEGSWAWGSLGYIPTGNDGGFSESEPADVLIDTIYALKAGYRQNANWIMNRRTQAEIRKLKDGDGNYLWQPPVNADARARLMGFEVLESEDMPDIGSDSTAMAFGDFRRGYMIVDRAGVSVLRDPYSSKPYVLFYITKRVGGGVQDFDAIKLIKFGTA